MHSNYSSEEIKLLKAFGLRIQEARKKKGYSQEELAFHSGLDRTYVGSMERGERNVSIINIRKIATALDLNVSELLKHI